MGKRRKRSQLSERDRSGGRGQIERDRVEIEALGGDQGTGLAGNVEIFIVAEGGEAEAQVEARVKGEIRDGDRQMIEFERRSAGTLIEVIDNTSVEREFMDGKRGERIRAGRGCGFERAAVESRTASVGSLTWRRARSRRRRVLVAGGALAHQGAEIQDAIAIANEMKGRMGQAQLGDPNLAEEQREKINLEKEILGLE